MRRLSVMIMAIVLTSFFTVVSIDASESNLDIELSPITLYGYFKGGSRGATIYLEDKEIMIAKGEQKRIEFSEYSQLDGVTPDIIDVETFLSNQGSMPISDIEVRLTIAIKLAKVIFEKNYPEKMINVTDTDKSAAWFNPSVISKIEIKNIYEKTSKKICFRNIKLGEIIDSYFSRRLWPLEVRFDVSAEPLNNEKSLANNVVSKNLKIPLPPY